jgi:uncharacterized protein YbjT (DUF2867 family)
MAAHGCGPANLQHSRHRNADRVVGARRSRSVFTTPNCSGASISRLSTGPVEWVNHTDACSRSRTGRAGKSFLAYSVDRTATASASRPANHCANAERLPESGYFRARIAQERLIEKSSIPYSIVHATQFFEFLGSIADAATVGGTVRLAPVFFQPIAGEDVAQAVGRVAVG